MSTLSELLERLRRMRPPPGPAAGVVAVPSTGDRLAGEVAFLFGALEETERQAQQILSTARSEVAEIEAAAIRERERLLEDARADAERLVSELLAQRRPHIERQVRALLADAEREAEQVSARARERTPALVQDLTERVLRGAS